MDIEKQHERAIDILVDGLHKHFDVVKDTTGEVRRNLLRAWVAGNCGGQNVVMVSRYDLEQLLKKKG